MFPALIPFLPKMTYRKKLVCEYIQLEKYQHLEHSEICPMALKVLSAFREYGKKQHCDNNTISHINRGIHLIGILYGKKTSYRISQTISSLLSRAWTIGPVHGDFHTANLLKTNENHPKVIDLDNFSSNGIQDLDLLNFIIDYEAKHSGQKWHEVLQKIVAHKNLMGECAIFQDFMDDEIEEIALLYVVNRLAYENSYYHLLSRSVQNEYAFIRGLAEKMRNESLS